MKINSIYGFIKNNKLTEELHVDGLNFLGNAFGYDVYDVRTWAAAQELVTGDDATPAGQAYTQDERTFTNNITETLRLYFFVKENTNKVRIAAINTGRGALNIRGRFTLNINNYSFEGRSENGDGRTSNNLEEGDILPLYLLPNIQYEGANGLVFEGSNIVGTFNGLVNQSSIPQEVTIPENITGITREQAFKDFCIPTVIIENNVQAIKSNAFKGYTGTIKCAVEEPEDAPWASNWNGDCNSIVWGIHLTPEEVARREEEARLERERREREEQERQERERRQRELQAAETLSILRYKKEGNEITITGCKPGREEIEVPEEIDGCKVTKVAPFAFYEDQALRSIKLPSTVKEIGKAAFYNCNRLTIYYPATAVLYTDALTGVAYKRAQ